MSKGQIVYLVFVAILITVWVGAPLGLLDQMEYWFVAYYRTDNENRNTANLLQIFENTPVYDLAEAVAFNDPRELSKLLSTGKYDLNYEESKYHMTVLMWAVRIERYSCIVEMLKHGADINYQSSINGSAALHFAANSYMNHFKESTYDRTDIIRLLLSRGADPNIEMHNQRGERILFDDREGFTPLMLAARSGYLSKCQALIDGGADINARTKYSQETAASIALMLRKWETAYYLICNQHADVTGWKYIYRWEEEHQCNEIVDRYCDIDYIIKWEPFDANDAEIRQQLIEEFSNQGVSIH